MLVSYKPFCVLLLLLYCSSAQTQSLQQKLDSFSGAFVSAIKGQEKAQAYLITDKSVFRAGEPIWFRSFLLNSGTQKVYTKTKYLFVDLVNDRDNVVSTVLLDASRQQLDGRILLPAFLPSGAYWLRAYTKQMAESNGTGCCIKPIYVIGKTGRPPSNMSVSKSSLRSDAIPILTFYPEGGAVITRTNTSVAFRIQDAHLNPVASTGTVKDEQKTVVARFASNQFGLGKFDFSPSPYKKYQAYLNWNGKEIGYALPSVNVRAGQVAMTNRTNGKIELRVLLEDSAYTPDVTTYLIGVSRDSLCFAAIGRGMYQLEVPEQSFPSGIATFYLFDNNFKRLSERSIYINQSNVIVKAATDKINYEKRDIVTLNASITNAANKPLPALVSIAAVDSTFNSASDCGIPYFDNLSSIDNMALAQMSCLTNQDIDLLMQMKNSTYSDKSQVGTQTVPDGADSLLFIKGKVFNENVTPAANTNLTLLSGSGNGIFASQRTDNEGRFSFPLYDYTDSAQFAIEAKDVNGKSMKVQIVQEPVLFPHFTTPVSLKHPYPVEAVFTTKYPSGYFDTTSMGAGRSLPGVTVQEKKGATYNNSKRVSGSSTIISADQLDERRSVGDIVLTAGGLHMLQGYLVINGLTAMKAPDASSEPLLLIDGVQTSANGAGEGGSPVINTLNGLSPKDIDFIEILKGGDGAAYGVRGGSGVILVNTLSKRRELNNGAHSNLQTFYAKGISKAPLFPIPNYDNPAVKSSGAFDNRSTIFWDGVVLTGTMNPMRFQFFTNDIPTTYKVTISGITAHGDVIYQTLTFYSK